MSNDITIRLIGPEGLNGVLRQSIDEISKSKDDLNIILEIQPSIDGLNVEQTEKVNDFLFSIYNIALSNEVDRSKFKFEKYPDGSYVVRIMK